VGVWSAFAHKASRDTTFIMHESNLIGGNPRASQIDPELSKVVRFSSLSYFSFA
jgi:hypothetical protein